MSIQALRGVLLWWCICVRRSRTMPVWRMFFIQKWLDNFTGKGLGVMKAQKIFQNSWIVGLLALLCTALWSSAFPVIKIGYSLLGIRSDAVGSQILFAGLRFTMAGIFTVVLGSLMARKLLVPKRSSGGMILRLCLLQTVIQYFFFYVGVAHTTGVKSAIITGTNSLLAIVIASLVFRQERLGGAKLLGCLVGFFGVILANLTTSGMEMGFRLDGEGFVFLAAVSYAFSSVFLKRYSKEEDPVTLSGYQFIAGGLVLLGIGLVMGGRLGAVTWAGAGVLVYLALLSAIAYSVWGILLKYNPVSRVAIYGFANPVMGVLLSALLLGEGEQAFSLKNVGALALVSLGVFIVNRFSDKVPDQK